MWESLVIRLPWEQENAGSNPAIPTDASPGRSRPRPMILRLKDDRAPAASSVPQRPTGPRCRSPSA